MTNLFISGMFRSGTTFLARMLNTHSKIACASDPLRPLFNSLRYDLSSTEYKSINSRFNPLNDYFIKNYSLLENVLETKIDLDIEKEIEKELIDNILNSATPYSQKWVKNFDKNKEFHNYKDLLEYSLNLINSTYGNQKSEVIAFKEVWTNEFIPSFLNSVDNSKAIILVRDPRAVLASNIASKEKYPIFFLARQWRKLAYLTNIISEKYPEKVLVLKYEDLITKPEENIKNINTFLNIKNEKALLDLKNYVDGDGNKWKKNTHYSDDKNSLKIDPTNINKWEKVLTDKELLFVELICKDWMEYFNYTNNYTIDDLISTNTNKFTKYKNDELANWIRPFSFDEDISAFQEEIIKEKLRLTSLNSELSENDKRLLQIR